MYCVVFLCREGGICCQLVWRRNDSLSLWFCSLPQPVRSSHATGGWSQSILPGPSPAACHSQCSSHATGGWSQSILPEPSPAACHSQCSSHAIGMWSHSLLPGPSPGTPLSEPHGCSRWSSPLLWCSPRTPLIGLHDCTQDTCSPSASSQTRLLMKWWWTSQRPLLRWWNNPRRLKNSVVYATHLARWWWSVV